MSETLKLLMEKDGAIGWIIFNQPEKRNAVSLEMWELMPEVRARTWPRTTPSAWSSSAAPAIRPSWPAPTSRSSRTSRRNMADQEEYRRISARGQDALETLGKPLLAMIHGFCVGGGVSIAISCDMRLASDDARFGMPAARLGLGYHYNGMDKLMKLVGPGLREGDLLHRAHRLQRAGRLADGAGQPGGAQGGAGDVHPRLRADHRAQRPAHHAARPRPRWSSS